MTDFAWWQRGVVYQIYPRSFQDGNGDGIGDFIGLSDRLPYLAGIGITCVWLLPFYPSPVLDDGYDVADYYGVRPALGTLGDFVDFMNQADELGIRVIVDLVVNHTSNTSAMMTRMIGSSSTSSTRRVLPGPPRLTFTVA